MSDPAGPRGRRRPGSLRSPGGNPAHVSRAYKTAHYLLKMEPGDYEELRQRAADAKRSVASYLRECALGRPPRITPPVNLKSVAELSRVGNNLNQIARRLNERTGDDPSVDELV